MPLSEIERLVTELLARGDMNADTAADLERILGEAKAGESQSDDLDYLSALHARIFATGDSVSEEAPSVDIDTNAALQAENERLRVELDAARNKIAELEERLGSGA